MNPALLNSQYKALTPVLGLQSITELAKTNLVFSSSFGQEDQVIADMIFKNKLPIQVFTLDTGRLFQETYDLMDRTRSKYKQEIISFFPERKEIEQLVRTKGFNSFYDSVENRKECCKIRKIVPLRRALKDAKVWITGLRAEQSENRAEMEMFEWDAGFEILKYNPLINWSYQDVLDYISEHKVPDNPLHRQGFVSIGCLPCTRAIVEGEHPRAGRWSWEQSQKECGLHS